LWQAGPELIRHHHELRPAREQREILILQDASDGSSDVVRWSLQNDREAWRWALSDHLSPPQTFPDWSHINSVSYVPGEEALVLSSRNLNAVFKVDLTSELIVWALGFAGRVDEDGFLGDFAMAADDRFFHQHDPEVQENGNVLLFDNGAAGTRQSSRAIELELDETSDPPRAQVVWEYSPNPVIFAPIWGDADRLPNGNTLVTFGQRSDDPKRLTTFIEVDPEGEVVWRAQLPVKWGSYRAERLIDTPRGFVGPAP
jgi:hypothetical protein